MKNNVLILGLTMALAALSSVSAAPVVVKKEYDVQSGGKIVVQVDRGDVEVKTADSSKVQITVERELRGARAEEQERLLKDHQLEFSNESNEVRVKASRPKSLKGFSFRDPFNKLRVRYTIVVPAKFNAELHTAGGNIKVAALEGKVDAQTAGGNVELESIKGAVLAKTSGGNVRLLNAVGDSELGTSGGNIEAGSVEGNLLAKTSGGDIRIEKVTGTVEARTSGGNIQINEAGNTVLAQTSGGNVSARLSSQPKGDCSLRTSGGNVELSVAENVALNVSAETSGGSIQSAFGGDMNKARTRLSAKINGGGPTVALSTSGGDVRVTKK